MAEKEEKKQDPKGIKIVNGYAELKPSPPGKRPTQICIGAKTYKGDYSKIVGKDDKGKPVVELVKSKVKFVPEACLPAVPEQFHSLFVQS